MYGALTVALSTGPDSWLSKEFGPGESVRLWQSVCEWHEGNGSTNTRYQQALCNIQRASFSESTATLFDAYCNNLMESFRILEDIGRPLHDDAKVMYFLDGVHSPACSTTVAMCCHLNNN